MISVFSRTFRPQSPRPYVCNILTQCSFLPLTSRGALSKVFLYFVDVEKSRKECEAFITAEARRDAFAADSAPVVAVVEKN